MKTLAITALVALGFCSLASAEEACPPHQIVNVQSLTEKDLNNFMKGESSHPVTVFPEGSVLPLHIFLRGDLFRFLGAERSAKIEVLKTFYVMNDQGKQLFCTDDMTDWKPFFEFITGTVSVSIDNEAEITLRAETNPKS